MTQAEVLTSTRSRARSQPGHDGGPAVAALEAALQHCLHVLVLCSVLSVLQALGLAVLLRCRRPAKLPALDVGEGRDKQRK